MEVCSIWMLIVGALLVSKLIPTNSLGLSRDMFSKKEKCTNAKKKTKFGKDPWKKKYVLNFTGIYRNLLKALSDA